MSGKVVEVTTLPKKSAANRVEEYDWLDLKAKLHEIDEADLSRKNIGEDAAKYDNVSSLIWAKVQKHPFIHLGMAMTIGCVGFGVYSIVRPDWTKKTSNYLMRGRVGSHAVTLVAMGVAMLCSGATIKKGVEQSPALIEQKKMIMDRLFPAKNPVDEDWKV